MDGYDGKIVDGRELVVELVKVEEITFLGAGATRGSEATPMETNHSPINRRSPINTPRWEDRDGKIVKTRGRGQVGGMYADREEAIVKKVQQRVQVVHDDRDERDDRRGPIRREKRQAREEKKRDVFSRLGPAGGGEDRGRRAEKKKGSVMDRLGPAVRN